MTIESKILPINIDIGKIKQAEKPSATANRMEIIKAGNFLQRSGLMDAVMQYEYKLRELTPASDIHSEIESHEDIGDHTLYNDVTTDTKVHSTVQASIVFEWAGPNESKVIYRLRISALTNNQDRLLSASVRKIRNQKTNFIMLDDYFLKRDLALMIKFKGKTEGVIEDCLTK